MDSASGIEILIGLIALIAGTWFWFSFMHRRDKFEPEPVRALLWVMSVGGLLSMLAAWAGNEILAASAGSGFARIVTAPDGLSWVEILGFFLCAAFNEEFFKYTFAYWLIRKNKQVNEPLDGLIYSVAVGLGFSIFENVLYMVMHGSAVILPRMIFAVPMHMATAAIWGYAISKTLALGKPLTYGSAFPLVLVATVFHGLWNSSTVMLGLFFIILAPFVLRFCFKKCESVISDLHLSSPFKP